MSDGEKITLGWLGIIVVLGIAAAIRWSGSSQEPPLKVSDPFEDWAERSTPECARIIRNNAPG
jgi:hypothetical protein